jgi:hypothetical protein
MLGALGALLAACFVCWAAPAAYAEANAVIPTSSAAGESTSLINNYESVSFPANDDGTWGPEGEEPQVVPFGFEINFFGTKYGGAYINNNGNITFQERLAQFTPESLTTFGSPIIAAFFADVDTRGEHSALVNFGKGTLAGKKVFVVNWPGVGCYAGVSSVLNNFQLIVIDRPDRGTGTGGDDFDIEFNYNTVQWDTGQASGGNENCLAEEGGVSAYAGYTNGTSTTGDHFEITGSGVHNAFLDTNASSGLINNSINSTTLGRYLFTVVGGQPTTPTSIKTSLSGEGKTGESIAVKANTPVTDSATLSGENASTATGKVTYKVYSDNECTKEVASGGEVAVTAGSVPSSNSVELANGTYYWQAQYSGDSANGGSVSKCGVEVETVSSGGGPQPTQLTTSLSGGGQSGSAITVPVGTSVGDQATLSGANSSTATGKVTYKVYSDNECTKEVASAGEVEVTAGSVPASSTQELGPGTYYWQASYGGDSGNESSKSTCGSEVETVEEPPTSTELTTSLSGGGHTGATITVEEGTVVTDSATLTGERASSASGKVKYAVYSDNECSKEVASAGEVEVLAGSVPSSTSQTLGKGTYYWQASYSGDVKNAASKSTCGSEVETVTGKAITGCSKVAGLGYLGEGPELAKVKESLSTNLAAKGQKFAFSWLHGKKRFILQELEGAKCAVSKRGVMTFSGHGEGTLNLVPEYTVSFVFRINAEEEPFFRVTIRNEKTKAIIESFELQELEESTEVIS